MAVCAPEKTERPPADRVKTDKRDAIRMAKLLAAGELTLVTIQSVERDQLRDLVRCREDIRADLTRARHRIGKYQTYFENLVLLLDDYRPDEARRHLELWKLPTDADAHVVGRRSARTRQ